MPAWTQEQLNEYERRRKQDSVNSAVSRAFPEPIVCHEPVAAQKGKGGDPKRIHVRIVSYRKRLCDPDNLCGKYFVDCLRYAKIIPNDRPEDITLEITQEKSKDERTEIHIETPERFVERK